MPHLRFCAPFALLCAALLPGPTLAAAVATTDPAIIKVLAADAYIWGLGPEFIWRFAQYNTIIGAPFNAFKYGQVPAAWNNEATNAGDPGLWRSEQTEGYLGEQISLEASIVSGFL
jgi:hypothetical protein